VASLFAYFYFRQQDKKKFVMAPFGLASVKGTTENFELRNKAHR
jgi:hypothetical protein